MRLCVKMGWFGGSLTVIGGKERLKDRVLHLGLGKGLMVASCCKTLLKRKPVFLKCQP